MPGPSVAPTTLPGLIRHPPDKPPEPVANGTAHALTCWDAESRDKTVGRGVGREVVTMVGNRNRGTAGTASSSMTATSHAYGDVT